MRERAGEPPEFPESGLSANEPVSSVGNVAGAGPERRGPALVLVVSNGFTMLLEAIGVVLGTASGFKVSNCGASRSTLPAFGCRATVSAWVPVGLLRLVGENDGTRTSGRDSAVGSSIFSGAATSIRIGACSADCFNSGRTSG